MGIHGSWRSCRSFNRSLWTRNSLSTMPSREPAAPVAMLRRTAQSSRWAWAIEIDKAFASTVLCGTKSHRKVTCDSARQKRKGPHQVGQLESHCPRSIVTTDLEKTFDLWTSDKLDNRRHQKHKPMMHSWQALTCFAPQNGHEAGKKSDSFISSHFKYLQIIFGFQVHIHASDHSHSFSSYRLPAQDLAAWAQDAESLDDGLRIVEERHF